MAPLSDNDLNDLFWINQNVIDCDIHNEVPNIEVLKPYLSDHWRSYIEESAFRGPDSDDYPEGAPTSVASSFQKTGSGKGNIDIVELREGLLEKLKIEFGILNCAYRVQAVHDEQLALTLSSAVNQWQVDTWLSRDTRLRGSIVIPSQNPMLAVKEIDRWGHDSRFVQVIMPVRSLIPYGSRKYDPIYEAVVRHGLVLGIQFGGSPGHPSTPSGWLSTYAEEFASMSQVFQSQVMSLIVEGAFDRFPTLKVSLIEGGFTWMPPLMWRLDKEWKGLRRNIPWVKKPPSEYIRKHIRLTLQPIDGPGNIQQFLEVIGQLDSEEMLMFSTDYPHWQFDCIEEAFPLGLSREVTTKILLKNAQSFYRF